MQKSAWLHKMLADVIPAQGSCFVYDAIHQGMLQGWDRIRSLIQLLIDVKEGGFPSFCSESQIVVNQLAPAKTKVLQFLCLRVASNTFLPAAPMICPL